jgi:hypothetical protein
LAVINWDVTSRTPITSVMAGTVRGRRQGRLLFAHLRDERQLLAESGWDMLEVWQYGDCHCSCSNDTIPLAPENRVWETHISRDSRAELNSESRNTFLGRQYTGMLSHPYQPVPSSQRPEEPALLISVKVQISSE